MPRFADNLTATADITTTTVTDGEVRANIGESTDGTGVASDAIIYGIDGFVSRPSDADARGAAQCVYLNDGNSRRIIAANDNRFADKVGELKPGDRAIVSDCDARIFLKKETSAVVHYTVNQKTNASMIFEVNGQDGEIRIVNGKSAIIVKDGEIIITNGKTAILADDDGFFVNGAHCGLNTNGGNLGTMAADIPPIAPAMSVLTGVTGMAGAPSMKWTIAP